MSDKTLEYIINDMIELNLSYMPFLKGSGLFVPTPESFRLGEEVMVNLKLPIKNEPIEIAGKVVWIIPPNSLHHVLCGIGITFIGPNAANIKAQLEAELDKNFDVGGYTCGVSSEPKESSA